MINMFPVNLDLTDEKIWWVLCNVAIARNVVSFDNYSSINAFHTAMLSLNEANKNKQSFLKCFPFQKWLHLDEVAFTAVEVAVAATLWKGSFDFYTG